MINATTNFQNFSAHRHFKWKHLIVLMTQSKASEPIASPHVRIVVVRNGRHVAHATTDAGHTTRRIKLITTKQCGRYTLWLIRIVNAWSKA